MSESVPKTRKSATSKKTVKPAVKKVSVTFEKEMYDVLEKYTNENFISIETFIKKAVQEKLDRDRISTMIDYMSGK